MLEFARGYRSKCCILYFIVKQNDNPLYNPYVLFHFIRRFFVKDIRTGRSLVAGSFTIIIVSRTSASNQHSKSKICFPVHFDSLYYTL